MIWHVVACYDYDSPRDYTKLLLRLGKAGVDVPYIPVEPQSDHHTHKQELVPIMPGYVFLGFRGRPDWRAIIETRGVLHFLGGRGPERRIAVVPEADIKRLREIERELAVVKRAVDRWRPRVGEKVIVRLANGPALVEVQEIRNARVLAMLSFLGGLRAVDVPMAAVERAA